MAPAPSRYNVTPNETRAPRSHGRSDALPRDTPRRITIAQRGRRDNRRAALGVNWNHAARHSKMPCRCCGKIDTAASIRAEFGANFFHTPGTLRLWKTSLCRLPHILQPLWNNGDNLVGAAPPSRSRVWLRRSALFVHFDAPRSPRRRGYRRIGLSRAALERENVLQRLSPLVALKRTAILLYCVAIFLALDFLVSTVAPDLIAPTQTTPGKVARIPDPIVHHNLAPRFDGVDRWGETRYRLDHRQPRVQGRHHARRPAEIRHAPGVADRQFLHRRRRRRIPGHVRGPARIAPDKQRTPKIEFLNAGLVSYSPTIYYAKVKHLIEIGLQFDEARGAARPVGRPGRSACSISATTKSRSTAPIAIRRSPKTTS